MKVLDGLTQTNEGLSGQKADDGPSVLIPTSTQSTTVRRSEVSPIQINLYVSAVHKPFNEA